MSLYDNNDFSFTPYVFDFEDDKLCFDTIPITSLSLPSPPSSITSSASEVESGIEFDIESFTHCSPGTSFIPSSLSLSLSLPFTNFLSSPPASSENETRSNAVIPSGALSPLSSIVSPRSSIGGTSEQSFNSIPSLTLSQSTSTTTTSETEAAEALSNHHLQRYLHYKSLAAQAEAESRVLIQAQNDQFGTLLSSCDLNLMSGDQLQQQSQYDTKLGNSNSNANANGMLGYPNLQQSQFYNVGLVNQQWNNSFTYQPDQAAFHRQAEAHIQAHESALRLVNSSHAQAQAQQQAEQRQTERFTNFYMPTNGTTQHHQQQPTRQSFDGLPTWSRDSALTQLSGNSLPTTPYSSLNIGLPIPPAAPPMHQQSISLNEEDEGEDESSEYGDQSRATSEDVKPIIGGMPIPNLHGGGRGYVPGKTPDDPKKRHKCRVCGRGFARAFNLKSHAQTHNPTRPKPFQCPHQTCKRGFSRLHDLERHRQGIHSDGPLVDAKLNGVPPSVARAQNRIQRRAERGALI